MSNEELLQAIKGMIQEEIKPIISRLDKLEGKVDTLDEKLDNVKGQPDENTGFIKVLIHRTDIISANVDGLKVDTLSKESLEHFATNLVTKEDVKVLPRIETKLNLLESRLFEQETTIRLLTVEK